METYLFKQCKVIKNCLTKNVSLKKIFITLVASYLNDCLKKLTALFFIVLFLFNLFGYRLVVRCMQMKVSNQLEISIDNNLYQNSQLVQLKVPLHLPYQTNWSAFQRVNGELEIDGIMYKYVKRKIANDTLYLICILNSKKMHLESAINNFFKISNDLAQNNTTKKSINFKNIQSDFDTYFYKINTLLPFKNTPTFFTSLNTQKLVSSPHLSPEQPPDLQRRILPIFSV